MNWTAISFWLETWGKRVGVPALAVSVLALSVAMYSLYLSYPSDRPELATAGPRLLDHAHPVSVLIYWDNIGKKVARRGTAVLFTEDEARSHREKMGVPDIEGAGTNIIPGFSGSALFKVDMTRFLGLFLVCASYFDQSGNTYNQAFILRKGEASPGQEYVPLDEVAQPDGRVCP
jgi:hypothetical protein